MPLVIVDLPFSKGRFNAAHSCRLPVGKQSAATLKSVAAPVIPSHSM
ncbi:hypothetical protein J2X05_002866 [Cellvibrio fibrivorans]|uniref:Uncharacterized protein n=1 Tax=Cellvibrio fibrivorans TaxID=126350 RepID=A0ABU1V072_9GAMM|nr:hypothetical protein [Cellvibrio fibrivorans]